MKSKPISYFLAGTVIAVVGIIMFVTYYYTGLSFESNFLSYIPVILTFILVAFFVVSYAKAMDNNVTFGGLFGYGFKTTTIYVLLITTFMLLVNYLLPAYKEKFLEHFSSQLNLEAKLSDEQKEVAITTTGKYFTLLMVGGSLFINLLTGTFASLLGAAVAKKNPQTPFDTQM